MRRSAQREGTCLHSFTGQPPWQLGCSREWASSGLLWCRRVLTSLRVQYHRCWSHAQPMPTERSVMRLSSTDQSVYVLRKDPSPLCWTSAPCVCPPPASERAETISQTKGPWALSMLSTAEAELRWLPANPDVPGGLRVTHPFDLCPCACLRAHCVGVRGCTAP